MKATGPQAPTSREARCLGVDQLSWAVKLTIHTGAGLAVIGLVVPRTSQTAPVRDGARR